jgi:predicted 3-demethylubiquinone-9 3-methyltransferase (glyoxalase superfamily)
MAITGAAPCMWFDTEAADAAAFYVATFPDAKLLGTMYYPEGAHRPAGDVLTVDFQIFGQRFIALNGGPQFPHSEAVSFEVICDTQAEIDQIWEALVADGGQASMCGWCKDKFGVSWQVTPRILYDYYLSPDRALAARVNAALEQMQKIDVAGIEAAAHDERFESQQPEPPAAQ